MNLSKVLKQKRDAEDRLRNRSPQSVFNDTGTTQSFNRQSDYLTKVHLADTMPHRLIENSITYKFGFKIENGDIKFMYEEVI